MVLLSPLYPARCVQGCGALFKVGRVFTLVAPTTKGSIRYLAKSHHELRGSLLLKHAPIKTWIWHLCASLEIILSPTKFWSAHQCVRWKSPARFGLTHRVKIQKSHTGKFIHFDCIDQLRIKKHFICRASPLWPTLTRTHTTRTHTTRTHAHIYTHTHHTHNTHTHSPADTGLRRCLGTAALHAWNIIFLKPHVHCTRP